jgi:excisionase family DNA binding protein
MSRPTSYELLAAALAEVVQDAVAEALTRMAGPANSEETALIGVPEAARRLNLDETTTKREIATGRLRSVLVGRRRLVPVDAIAEFADRLTGADNGARQPNGHDP